VSHVTSLPKEIGPRRLRATYELNDRVRKHAGEHLARAAAAVGARPIVSTVAFWYEPGPGDADENTPLWLEAPEPIRRSVWTLIELETALELAGAVVLRCGALVGPGTYYERSGSFGKRLAKGRFPIIGAGAGVTSFVHVDDVAEATLDALDLPPGTYNVVDDEPAASRVWIPEFAAAYGGPAPKTVPSFAARLVLGPALQEWNARSRGASNRKLRAAGWAPRQPSWRKALSALR
jgi:nucleoside-diphosphate-sugar epimerase